jgi:hypothetical protein
MKKILLLICAAGLLGSAGCVVMHGNDQGDDHHSSMFHDAGATGVDHGEYPGDTDHDPNR